MAESKYEKYIIRNPIHPDPSLYEGGAYPTMRFLEGSKPAAPIPTNTLLEYILVTRDWYVGMSDNRGVQEHDFDEVFAFIGTDGDNPEDLGGEVEFWMGEGDDTEVIKLNKTSAIYCPGGMRHMPIFFRNVKKPFLMVVIGVNVGDMNVRKFPHRGTI